MRLVRWVENHPNVHRSVVVVSLVLLVGLLMLVSGCSSGSSAADDRPAASNQLDKAATDACNTFARWEADGADHGTRVKTASNVNQLASLSNVDTITQKASRLYRVSLKTDDNAWTLVADSFAYECVQLGWTADDAS